MSFYSSNHPGVILDDITLTNLRIPENDLRGYFSISAINTLLEKNSDCVGIRVYNIITPKLDDPALIAVCVFENGSDKQLSSHLVSTNITPKPNSNNTTILSRNAASSLFVEKDTASDLDQTENFSSFLSNEMLRNLEKGLIGEDAHKGLAFYKIIWLGGRSTHLVVTSNLKELEDNSEKKSTIIGLDGTGFNNCLSDQPCPGHCVNVNEDGKLIISPEPLKVEKGDLKSHYIPVWDS